MQGVRPGPHLFTEQPALLYIVFASMFAANLLYLVVGLGAAKLFARLTLVPPAFLWPSVLVLSIVGAYAPNQAIADVWTMLIFGVVGFLFRRFGFSPAPLIMGLVLGKLLEEESMKQALLIFDQNWWMFLSRPIVVTLFAVTLLGLVCAVPGQDSELSAPRSHRGDGGRPSATPVLIARSLVQGETIV